MVTSASSLRPLTSAQRWRLALRTTLFRLMRSPEPLAPPYAMILGTPGPQGLTVAPDVIRPWPDPAVRLYGDYVRASGFNPPDRLLHVPHIETLSAWYVPYLFLWTSWLQLIWNREERWTAYTEDRYLSAHLVFRVHAYHHRSVWVPYADDEIWSRVKPARITDFWLEARPVFDALNASRSIAVGSWLAEWGPDISTFFRVHTPISALRRMMLLSVMLLSTGIVTAEYAETALATPRLAAHDALSGESSHG